MTTTSLIHHKPPPLATRNDNPTVYLRANNYYGSIGRPSHGRRKSAVELLQETKALYVKSDSVLDARQEFKNAEHLHVAESPPQMDGTQSLGHPYRGGPTPPSAPPTMSNFPYATFSYSCTTCPPYPHEHLDHLHLMHANYINSIKREKHSQKAKSHKVTAKITLIDGTQVENWGEYEKLFVEKKGRSKRDKSKEGRGQGHVTTTLPTHSASNGTITFTSFSQSGSLYSGLEKQGLPPVPVSSSQGVSVVSQGRTRDRKDTAESDSPPPLPPKSPRTNAKPNRPSDFPQRLVHIPPPISMAPTQPLPPPPPRKHRSKSKGMIELPENPSGTVIRKSHGTDVISQHMTLPSPILPPTPPPDVVMESPMSDSGPIISPPPAFSTPVTPMLDRQNSTVSDRSAKTFGAPVNNSHPTHLSSGSGGSGPNSNSGGKPPLSTAVSMSGVSSISSRSQSHAEDASLRYSPNNRSRSRLSSSSPMSHQDADGSRRASESASGSVFSSNVSMAQVKSSSGSNSNTNTASEDESDGAISADVDGDDDDSSRAADDHVQSYHLSVGSSKLFRNNSRKSAASADGVIISSNTVQRRSPSRGRNGRVVSSSSSGGERKDASGQSQLTGSNAGGKISKSVTENFLSRVSNGTSQVNPEYSSPHYFETHTLPLQHTPKPRKVSPVRRPILRSKSDLSHRYLKASKGSTLTPGFTLVQVDLGPLPPIPTHNSISTVEFPPSSTANKGKSGGSNHYQTPSSYQAGSGNHYMQPHQTQSQMYHTLHPNAYHTLQPTTSSHYAQPHAHHYATLSTPHPKVYAKPSMKTYENVLLNHSNKTELDRFFDQLGLDGKSSLPPPSAPLAIKGGMKGGQDGTGSESPVFFSSISSIDSCARKSGSGESEDSPVPAGKVGVAKTVGAPGYSPPNNNGGNQNNNNGPSLVVHHGEPSIVERNARVIKWLFNCRKAMENKQS